jgi:hypothetical protein
MVKDHALRRTLLPISSMLEYLQRITVYGKGVRVWGLGVNVEGLWLGVPS